MFLLTHTKKTETKVYIHSLFAQTMGSGLTLSINVNYATSLLVAISLVCFLTLFLLSPFIGALFSRDEY